MLVIKNSYLVEVPFPVIALNQRYNFPDIPKLRNKRITGIEAVVNSVLSNAPSGAPVIAGGLQLLVTLQNEADVEIISQSPYFGFIASQNAGIVKELNGVQINLVKSYLTIISTTSLNANDSAALVFYYE